MPSADQFTPAFVGSFIARCFELGLTKEATTHLLTLSATTAAHENQGFAAGFDQRLAELGLEKSAWAMAGKLMAGGLAAAGLGGAGIYGYNKARDAVRGHNRQAWGDVPLAGVYDPRMAAASEAEKLRMASQGVLELNKNVGRDGRRMHELQSVIDSEGPGGASAIAELQQLRRSPYAGQRARYAQELQRYNSGTNQNLQTVRDDLNELGEDKGSFWNRTRSFLGFPRDFDTEERQLEAQRSRLAEQARMSSQLYQRLRSGATAVATHPPLEDDLQQRFFHTR